MGHGHHHGHDHAHGGTGRALWISLFLTLLLGVIQIAGAVAFDSLALISDAVHNLSDVVAVGLAVGAAWLAGLPATGGRTFGFRRAEVLAAVVNSILLIAMSLWIAWEAVHRLGAEPAVAGGGVAVVGAVGVVLNAVPVVLLLRAGARHNLNANATMLHFAADVLSSVAALAAGVLIALTGWVAADAIASVFVAVLIGVGAVRVLRDAVRVLLEVAPPGLDVDAIGRRLCALDGVVDVHDLHVWQISDGFPMLATHVIVGPGVDPHAMLHQMEDVLRSEFDLAHVTIQIDVDHARGLAIRPRLEQPRVTP